MRRLWIAAPLSLAALAACFVLAPAVANAQPQSGGGSTSVVTAIAGVRPLRECTTPSIDRLQQWLASGEGTTVPATGSLLVPARQGHRDGYSAEVTFLNAEWHVVVVWLANRFEAQVDLSGSAGFWLTYSATDDLYVQLRPASHWSGGAQWATAVPSTHGRTVTRFFSFRPQAWTAVAELGVPAHSFASAVSEARGLVFVGKTANELTFRGMRFHRYTPPCL